MITMVQIMMINVDYILALKGSAIYSIGSKLSCGLNEDNGKLKCWV